MCTVVLNLRPGNPWPVCLAANRDERTDRPWSLPAAYWPEHPGTVAGRDLTAGGTWLGVNREGVVAAVLNRPGSLGPAAGKRSRGELPLIALHRATAAAAAETIHATNSAEWRGFNMVIADRTGAFFIRGAGHGHPAVLRLPPGVSMVTSHDPNDLDSPRVAHHLPRFQAAATPSPDDWSAWRTILSDQSGSAGEQINVADRGGYGTVSSCFIALPSGGDPLWLFAAGAPHEAPFLPVTAGSAASRP